MGAVRSSSSQASYQSLPHLCESSFSPLLLLSQRNLRFFGGPVLRQSARFRLSEGFGGIFTVTVQVFNCQDRSDQNRSLHLIRNWEPTFSTLLVFLFFIQLGISPSLLPFLSKIPIRNKVPSRYRPKKGP